MKATFSADTAKYLSKVTAAERKLQIGGIMTAKTQQIAELAAFLPDTEQALALEIVKRLVLAWDPDYTKVTAEEAAAIRSGMEQFECGEIVRFDEIDW
jgi:hypothetical protein